MKSTLHTCVCSTSFASGSGMHFVFSSSSTILMTSTSCILPVVPCFSLKYCVCYIHEEFNRLLQVLKKDSVVSHENCDCTCPFYVAGNCRCVFTSDMDLYWFTRHMMCTPSKLHSKTSRNLFPPSNCFFTLMWPFLSCPVSFVWMVGAPQNPLLFWSHWYDFSVPQI